MTMYACYVFSPNGRVLMTRRALGDVHWPAAWMCSWWGVTAPGQAPADALESAVRVGLGIGLRSVRLLRPDFPYDVDVSGVDTAGPVFTATTPDLPTPNPRVVMDWRWVDWRRLLDLTEIAAWTLCPWVADQVPEVDRHLADGSVGAGIARSDVVQADELVVLPAPSRVRS